MGDNTLVGAGGEYSDFQKIQHMLEDITGDDRNYDDGENQAAGNRAAAAAAAATPRESSTTGSTHQQRPQQLHRQHEQSQRQ